MSSVTLRKALRSMHVIGSLILGTFLYSPWSSNPVFAAFTLYLLVPVMALSGLAMWKMSWVLHFAGSRRVGASQSDG